MKNNSVNLLIDKAKEASKNAYSVYSHFPVGAALINSKGEIYTGCNVENISFGLTNCAERTAIFKGVSEGSTTIETIVIYTPTQKPTPPCGACRQVISEFNKKARIISVCNTDECIDTNLDFLLPNTEFPMDLKK